MYLAHCPRPVRILPHNAVVSSQITHVGNVSVLVSLQPWASAGGALPSAWLPSFCGSLLGQHPHTRSQLDVYLGYGLLFYSRPLAPAVSHERLLDRTCGDMRELDWSSYCHGDALPRYTPSTRCNCSSQGLTAFRAESIARKDRSQQTSCLFTQRHNSFRALVAGDHESPWPLVPANTCQQMAVMQKYHPESHRQAVISQLGHTYAYSAVDPRHTPKNNGRCKRVQSDGTTTKQWQSSVM